MSTFDKNKHNELRKNGWSWEGAGGGGASSWNDLTDKPFGTEIQMVPLATNASVYIYDNFWANSDDFTSVLVDERKNIFGGAEAVMTIGGTEYKCKWVDMGAAFGWDGWFAIGNLGGGAYSQLVENYGCKDTGEPFYIETQPSTGKSYMYYTTAGEHTFSLSSEAMIDRPIDAKYLTPAKEITVQVGMTTIKEIKDALEHYAWVTLDSMYHIRERNIWNSGSNAKMVYVERYDGVVGKYEMTIDSAGVITAVSKSYMTETFIKGDDGNNYRIYVDSNGAITAEKTTLLL